jgi:hypothetical protein
MWTYSGFFIEKREDKLFVYSNDKRELEMFADEQGCLLTGCAGEESFDYIKDFCKEPGLYQALIGYGSWQEPTVYNIKKVAEVDWSFGSR